MYRAHPHPPAVTRKGRKRGELQVQRRVKGRQKLPR
jgi:hypothetical protein